MCARMCIYVCGHVHVTAAMLSRDNLSYLALSFHHVASGDGNQSSGLAVSSTPGVLNNNCRPGLYSQTQSLFLIPASSHIPVPLSLSFLLWEVCRTQGAAERSPELGLIREFYLSVTKSRTWISCPLFLLL